ncbi:hypothetical protein IC235_08475 [Hymenobacter sp. BT664]|uniref:Uncharacterized protein n=1 Tax=Hymenobacter montanus TaxID=2771359 RepID=A0A927BD63_9BACT|nr:hypothetical protein [Hymenobacter montanus]MBD2767928.1 hypothetical protein [Hymenobacter montanus]
MTSTDGSAPIATQRLRDTLKAGVTYTFVVDVAYGLDFYKNSFYPGIPFTQMPITLQVWGASPQGVICVDYRDPIASTLLWSKLIPMARTRWQTDTVTFTPTADMTTLFFEATGTVPPRYGPGGVAIPSYTTGSVLLDNLHTIPSLALQRADGTAQAAGKAFRLLWQPVLDVGGLDSLARPQLRGTVTTFRGGRVPLPTILQVSDAKGFYFFQEATPAEPDTLYYGLYVRNRPLANGAKDDTLRHLYQCRQTFGSQAGLLGGSLKPLTLGSPPAAAAQRATAAPAVAPAPRRRPALPTGQQVAVPTPRPR